MHDSESPRMVSRKRRRFSAAISALAAAIAASLGLPTTTGAATNPLSRSTIPSPSHQTTLKSVDCPSASRCWAVGFYTNSVAAQLNEALRFNSGKWSLVSLPQPGGEKRTSQNELLKVTCPSPIDCWAVGEYRNSVGAELNEALHFNGQKWSSVSLPQPGKSSRRRDANELLGVTCASASDCWAAGFYERHAAVLNETLHWGGKKWVVVSAPQPRGTRRGAVNELFDVTCSSRFDCWAVGHTVTLRSAEENEALRWRGSHWAVAKTPQPGGTGAQGDASDLFGVSCRSPSHCLAVGDFETKVHPLLNQALRFTGNKWHRLSPPQHGRIGNTLASVWCASVSSCWAVGSYRAVNHARRQYTRNEALRWNGHGWAAFSVPEPGGTTGATDHELLGVTCVSASNCRAVGSVLSSHGSLNEATHWNGRNWSSR